MLSLTNDVLPSATTSMEFAGLGLGSHTAKTSFKVLGPSNAPLEVPEKFQSMLLRYESIQDGSRDETNMITHRVDVKPGILLVLQHLIR